LNNKIAVSTSTFDYEKNIYYNYLCELGFEFISNPYRRKLTESEAKEFLSTPGVIGLVAGVESLSKDVLSTAKNLRVIVRCGSGVDNVDFEACNKMGISVRNTPNAPAKAVAEFAIGHVLNMLRHIGQANEAMRSGIWQPILGGLLGSKTVGVIGYGAIGKQVVSLLSAFGAQVIVHDPKIDLKQVESKVLVGSLDDVLMNSDIIFLHVPYCLENKYLIGSEAINKMKLGAILANFSRGGVVEEGALFDALKIKHLGGACIDVFECEPYIGKFQELSNVILTPHMGSYAKESRINMEIEAMATLISELETKQLIQKKL
jgi:D-3-phosphoglycerate dehydrogenase